MKPKKYNVQINWEHLNFIIKNSEKFYPLETGGIFIGYWSSEYEIIVKYTIGPGPKAKHGEEYFIPDNRFHNKQIAKFYKQTKRTNYYLGDWHTHPDAGSYLSKKDRSTLKKISSFKPARMKNPIMMIFGTNPLDLKVWIYNSDLKKKAGTEFIEGQIILT
ncbi:MAG: Mov34/MPN/PAD-1 family protein [Candidatus Cyclobacteriaceae bacterium M2_1C_046]